MAVRSAAVTVGIAATLLNTGTDTGPSGSSVTVVNASAGDVFVGGPDVTTANGVRLAAGGSLSADLTEGEHLHAIVAAGTADVRVLHVGV
jgi:hypothetical protein